MSVPGCAFDTTEDWACIRDAGLVLRPMAYGPTWNGWVTPVVTVEEFERWVQAWSANDPNGEWGEVESSLNERGQLTMRHVTSDPATSDEWAAGEGGVFLVTGWTFVTDPAG